MGRLPLVFAIASALACSGRPSVPWQRVDDDVFDGLDLRDVWGVGEDVMILAWRSDGESVVVHFDGAGWDLTGAVEELEARSIWASARDDIWLAGQRLWHWDGAAWSAVDISAALGGAPFELGTVIGSGPNDVWVSAYTDGNEFSVSHILRHDGDVWTEFGDFTPASTDEPDDYRGVGVACANGPDDVWLVGQLGQDIEPPRIYYHWNGVELAVHERPGWVGHSPFCAGEAPWSLSNNQFENDSLYRPDGDGWVGLDPPVVGGRDYIKLHDLWVSEAGEAWIAGRQGTRAIGDEGPQVWRYADGEWSETIPAGGELPDLVVGPDAPGLRKVWQTASGRLFLAGPDGLVWEYDS